MCVGFHRLKVSRTHNVQSADTLAAGGNTFLLRVGMVCRWTAHTLEVDVTVTICKQAQDFQLQKKQLCIFHSRLKEYAIQHKITVNVETFPSNRLLKTQ